MQEQRTRDKTDKTRHHRNREHAAEMQLKNQKIDNHKSTEVVKDSSSENRKLQDKTVLHPQRIWLLGGHWISSIRCGNGRLGNSY